MYIHVNIFKMYTYVYLYIHNKCTPLRIHILDYDKIYIFQFSLLSLVNGVNSVITLADSYFDSLERSGSKYSIC